MAIVLILAVHLASIGRQQMLQGAKTILSPVPPLPRPDEPWPADGSRQTQQVVQRHTGLTDDDEGHGAIRRAGRPQPRIAHARNLLARPPRPVAVLLQVVAPDLAPIRQVEDIDTL